MLTTPPSFLSPQPREKLCGREARGKKGGESEGVCAQRMQTETEGAERRRFGPCLVIGITAQTTTIRPFNV